MTHQRLPAREPGITAPVCGRSRPTVTCIASLDVLTTAGAVARSVGVVAQPAPGITELVSVSNGGVQRNLDSDSPSMSGDSWFVAFVSFSDNLVQGGSHAHRP